MIFVFTIVISVFVGGFLGYKFGASAEASLQKDLSAAKSELAKIKTKL